MLFVPVRWLERHGWRPLCCHERTAAFVFYRELGRRMGIKSIPESYEAFEEFFDAFDREHVAYSEAGRRLMRASREAFTGYFPAVLAPLAGVYVDALLDDRMRQAVGVRRPPLLVRMSLHLVLAGRARLLGWMPLRRQPVEYEAVDPAHKYGFPIADIYPNGYEIRDLGPQRSSAGDYRESVASGQGASTGDREQSTASAADSEPVAGL
jgi:ER-bound oxygenase mpaB/B'/Rubber oxygenase, catalytic domain